MKRKTQLHILLISPYFYPHIGGSQRYMEELYVHLMETYKHISVDVVCYNTDNAPAVETYRGLTIYRIPGWQILPDQFALPNPIALCMVLSKLAHNNYTFVHTHLRFFDSAWWTWLYAKIIGAKSIFTEHVAGRPVHENQTVEAIANLVDHTLAAWSLPRYDLVTATNKSAQLFLNRTYTFKQNIRLVYGGVDTAYFSPIARNKRRIPGIRRKVKPTDIFITFVGRLIWAKGALKIYKIFRQLFPKLKRNVYFAIAGDGPLSDSIKKQIRQDNLENRVVFLGPLNTKGVRDTLQASDIFVHPSHHNEGFPNVILEAGASGAYVIATDVAGVREVIVPNKTGKLIPAGDDHAIRAALLWALTHTEKRKKIAKVLQKHLVHHFDWHQIVTGYYRLLTLAIKHH